MFFSRFGETGDHRKLCWWCFSSSQHKMHCYRIFKRVMSIFSDCSLLNLPTVFASKSCMSSNTSPLSSKKIIIIIIILQRWPIVNHSLNSLHIRNPVLLTYGTLNVTFNLWKYEKSVKQIWKKALLPKNTYFFTYTFCEPIEIILKGNEKLVC